MTLSMNNAISMRPFRSSVVATGIVAVLMLIGSGFAHPALAQETGADGGLRVKVDANGTINLGNMNVNLGAGAGIKADMKARATARADQEIARRISKLEQQNARIQAMMRVGADVKGSLNAALKAELAKLADMKAKIHADTDAQTFRADIQSITKSYRVFALVMPKAAIAAAAARVKSIADSLVEIGVKLEVRISAAATAGKDVAALTAALADLRTNAANAKAEADAAVALTTNLSPDNGDQATMQTNLAALQEARAKIRSAHEDLKAARQDVGVIIRGLKSFGIGVNATTTVSSTTP